MNKLLILLLLVTSITGCATNTRAMSEAEKQLLWVQDANPQQDAEAALAKGDFRLMALAQRSLVIPGIDLESSRKYELKCGVIIMQGVSDVIRSEQHLELMKLAHSYALKYNAFIKMHCKP